MVAIVETSVGLQTKVWESSVGNQLQQQEVSFLKPVREMVSDARASFHEAQASGKSWTLPGTGFTVGLQLEELLSILEENSGSVTPELYSEIVGKWAGKARENLLGFYHEYLSERIVYPIHVGLDKGRLVCPRYNNKFLFDTVTEKERNGAMTHAVKTLESYLASAAPDSYAFYSSPPGESGLRTPSGQSISYKDTQTYMFWKKRDGTVVACTLQSKMDLKQNEELLRQYGVVFPQYYQLLTESKKLEFITGQVIAGQGLGTDPFESIFHAVGRLVGSDSIEKSATLNDAIEQLSKLHQGTLDNAIPEQALAILQRVMIEIQSMPVVVPLIEYAKLIGETVLALAAIHAPKKSTMNFSHMDVDSSGNAYWTFKPDKDTLSFLQTRAGCNGGGSPLKSDITNPMSEILRTGITEIVEGISVSTTYSQESQIRCPECGWTPSTNEEHEALASGQLTRCPGKTSDGKICNWDPCTRSRN